MPDSLQDQATRAAIDAVKKERPMSFTVGGQFVDGQLRGGVSFDRTWVNGWGLTAYAYAWWQDATVSTHTPGPVSRRVTAGGELSKKF